MKTSNCCGAKVDYDSDICSDCKEHCSITCELCDGEGYVDAIDELRLYGKEVIDIPIKKIICPECQGEGVIE